MNLREALPDAINSLTGHKLRAGLSMLGMVFGVGAVIAMLSIGEGAEQQALEMVERLGLRNIVVQAKELARDDLMEIREKSPGLTSRDIDAIVEAVPGIEWVAPRVKIEPYKVVTTSDGNQLYIWQYVESRARGTSVNTDLQQLAVLFNADGQMIRIHQRINMPTTVK